MEAELVKTPNAAPPAGLAPLSTTLERVAEFEAAAVAAMSEMGEEDLLTLRQGAAALGAASWRIEAACDYYLIQHATAAPRGRGRRDEAGTGVQARVAQRARRIGVTPRTVQKNAQLFRLLQQARDLKVGEEENGVFATAILQDKGYYVAALAAPPGITPLEALTTFAQHKMTAERFRVTDAMRLMLGSPAPPEADPEAAQAADQAMVEHIRRTLGKLKDDIVPDCPSPKWANRLYLDFMQDLSDALDELISPTPIS